MPEISVIIPVYNSARYLAKCLESVCGQTLQDIEIICINDGSTDESLQILRDFKQKDSRIKIIDQKNAGVSEARNAGLDIATGKFISFVDSDDSVTSNYLEILEKLIHKTDLAICGFLGSCEVSFNDGILDLHTEDCNNIIKLMETGLLFSPWCKLYRADLIKRSRIRFNLHINYGEDLLFNIEYLYRIKTINVTSMVLYNYNTANESSLAKMYSMKRFENVDLQIIELQQYLKGISSSTSIIEKYVLKQLYWNMYDASFYLLNNFKNFSTEDRKQWIIQISYMRFTKLYKNATFKPHVLVRLFLLQIPTIVYYYMLLRSNLMKIST